MFQKSEAISFTWFSGIAQRIDNKRYCSYIPAGAGGRRHPRGAGGRGLKVTPLYFPRNISATRTRRSAKLCTHLLEFLAEVVCKFGADPISDDVTVMSEVRISTALSIPESNVTL